MAYFGGVPTRRASGVDLHSLMLLLIFLAVTAYALFVLKKEFIRPAPVEQVVVREVIKEVPVQVVPDSMDVLIPIKDIMPGQKLRASMFKAEKRAVIPGLKEKAVTTFAAVDGAYASSFIIEGTPLLNKHLTIEGPPHEITSQIPAGHRAVAIPVNSESGVEGWVAPGVRVDVVWSTMHRNKPIATAIVTNAYVLSAGQSTVQDRKSKTKPEEGEKMSTPRFVTLLVSAKDAQRIQLAKRAEGSLSLSLRGDKDRDEVGSETITIDSLLRPSDLEAIEVVNGTVSIAGKNYELRGKSLRPVGEENPISK